MDYKSKPNIGPNTKLNFSKFHPLDHNVWECKGYPGGRRTHLKYVWVFKWRGEVRSRTFCKVGIHRECQVWSRTETWTGCGDCAKKLSQPQPE